MTRNRTVLHLDDDHDLLNLVDAKLTSLGYDVISVDSPDNVIKKIVDSNAQVVILDINIPGTDGLALLKEIKQHNGGIQVVMLTGVVSMMTLLRSMRWGAEACVFKPLSDFNKLQTAIETAFEKLDCWWDSLAELRNLKPETEQTH